MNKKAKLLTLLLSPVLALGLVGCVNNGTPATGSSTQTPASSTNAAQSSITDSTAEDTSSTESSLLDEITGTAQSRNETFAGVADGSKATIYAELMAVETFTGNGNTNLYFMDGTYSYRVKNVREVTVTVGQVYKVVGTKDGNEIDGRGDNVYRVDTLAVVENGSTRVTGTKYDLDTADCTIANATATMAHGVVKTAGSDTIVVTTNATDYTINTRGVNEAAVRTKFATAQVGDGVTITTGIIAAAQTVRVLDADSITFGTAEEDYDGKIDYRGPLSKTVVGNILTIGGEGEVIEWLDYEPRNYISFEITKPRSAVVGEITITSNTFANASWNGTEETTTFGFPVEDLTKVTTVEVRWAIGHTETFTIQIADGTKLESEPMDGDVSLSNDNLTLSEATSGAYVVGATGETIAYVQNKGCVVSLVVDIPEDAVKADIKYTVGTTTVENSSIDTTGSTIAIELIATELNQVFEIEITWRADSETVVYQTQKFTVTISSDVTLGNLFLGTIGVDPSNTGSIDPTDPLTVNVDGTTITFGAEGEEIAWYNADQDLGRTEGNRVGVQINKPSNLDDASDAVVYVGETPIGKWSAVADDDGYLWWYPLITEENMSTSQTMTIYWDGNTDGDGQVFTVAIASGTTLESSFMHKITDSTIAEMIVKTQNEYNKLYGVTGVVQSIDSDSNGQGTIVDTATGQILTFYRLGADESMFDGYNPEGTRQPANDGTFGDIGLAIGDTITIHGIFVIYNSTPEIVGYCAEKVDYDGTKYEIHSSGDHATVTTAETTYAVDTDVEITVTVDNGYVVAEVLVNGKSVTLTDNKATIKMTPYTTVVVTAIEAVDYTISVDPAITNGTVTVDKPTAKYGETVTITVTPAGGYIIQSVSVNGSPIRAVADVYSFTVTENTTVTAVFVEAPKGDATTYVFCETDKYNSGVSGALANANNFAASLTGGANVITAITGTSNIAYKADEPLKLGTSNTKPATLTLTLTEAVTTVKIRAMSWNNVTTTITVNGVALSLPRGVGTNGQVSETYADLLFTIESSATIKIETSDRCLINQITFA